MFPCMGRDWRILATSPQQQRFLAEVTQESVPSRIQTVPASSMQDSQRKVMSWAKETGTWKAPNERKGKPKLEEGRRIQSEKRKTNSGTKTKEIQLKNAEIGMPKWEEGKAQTGGREKSSCTAAPSGLMPGSSMKRSEFTCWRYQLCALFSTFNEHFCHNLPWKENSPLIGPSFSRPSTQEGRGTWLVRHKLRHVCKT